MTRLLVQSPDGAQPLADLDTLQVFTIGRASGNDARFNDPAISSHHIRLDRTAQGWALTDLNSANGTSVDGIPVTGTVPLAAPAEIVLGESVVLQFTDDSARPRKNRRAVGASEATWPWAAMRTRTEHRREVPRSRGGQVEIASTKVSVVLNRRCTSAGRPAGMAKDTASVPRSQRARMPSDACVHPRPDADRLNRHRDPRDDPEARKRFRFIKGPISPPSAGRRNQPPPPRTQGPARGDAGEMGHGRNEDLQAGARLFSWPRRTRFY